MAFRKHLKLPPYRLTQRCGTAVNVRSVHRGENQHATPPSTSSESERVPSPCPESFEQAEEESTLHELQSKASVKGWSKIRNQLLKAAVSCSELPANQLCIVCNEPALLRCQQCGPLIHYCDQCFSKQHNNVNLFHVAEKWEVT